MTTNLKLRFDGLKEEVMLIADPSDNTKGSLHIQLSHYLAAWNNSVAADVNGLYDLENTGFPINDNNTDNVKSPTINLVRIDGSMDILETFYNLIILKERVRDWGSNAQNLSDFELIIDKDISNQGHHWTIEPEKNPGDGDGVLVLEAADFGGKIEVSKISIDDTIYHGDDNNQIEIAVNRKDQKQALLDLEKLLKRLETNYLWRNGPDADLIDPTPDLGSPLDDATGTPATGLWAWVVGKPTAGEINVPEDSNNIKHIINGLTENDAGTIFNFRGRINELILNMNIVKYSLNLGLTKKSEIVIFLQGGNYSFVDEDEIILEPRFYKGFPLFDPNLEAVLDSNNRFNIQLKDPRKPIRYTKRNVDNLRNAGNNCYTTNPDDNPFTKKKTIKDRDDNDVQVYANRQPNELLGFQPGDIWNAKIAPTDPDEFCYVNGNWVFKGRSKIFYDLLSAQNAQEAMDLAFFGKDYDEPQSEKAIRKGNPRNHYEKNPNVNLQFNEVKDWSHLEHLEHYYRALQSSGVEWLIPGDASGAGAQPAPKYDDPDTKNEIDKNYNLAKDFITDYENLMGVTIANLNKTQLEEAKSKLEKWKTTRFYTGGGGFEKP